MELADRIRACRTCITLRSDQEESTLPVPPFVGSEYAVGGLAVICEAPGFYEARDGEPLVGNAGKMFDKLAERAGLSRELFLLDNSVRCRPRNNRIADYPEAVAACSAWTNEVFAEYQPAVVVLMGRVAIRSIFGADATVGATRGTFAATPKKHPWQRRVITCTYHPAAAIYGGGEHSEVAKQIVADLVAANRAWEVLR